ncbi:MAG TPA: hypothetical protein VGL04_05410 [Sporichthyaceae bacterium]|jgi:hypothetical protein
MVATAAPAGAADTPNPKVTTTGATNTVRLVSRQTTMTTNGAAMSEQSMPTPKPGDKWEFADDLSQDGTKVGSDSVRCTVAAVDKLNCVATTTFNNGTLVVKGTAPMGMDDNMAFDVPIVSGTGAYEGATGTFHLANVAGSKGADANLTYTYTTAAASPTATPAATTSNPKVSTAGDTHTLMAFSHGTKFLSNGTMMTAPPTGEPKPGDTMDFNDDLSQGGAAIGSDVAHCVVLADHKVSCAATETFGNGTIVGKGTFALIDGPDVTFDIPIVSGTGAYDGATGTFHLASVPGTNGQDANVTLTYRTSSAGATTSDTAKTGSATQVTKVPAGGAETGGGSTAGVEHGWLLALGALTAAAGAGTVALGRRGR